MRHGVNSLQAGNIRESSRHVKGGIVGEDSDPRQSGMHIPAYGYTRKHHRLNSDFALGAEYAAGMTVASGLDTAFVGHSKIRGKRRNQPADFKVTVKVDPSPGVLCTVASPP